MTYDQCVAPLIARQEAMNAGSAPAEERLAIVNLHARAWKLQNGSASSAEKTAGFAAVAAEFAALPA